MPTSASWKRRLACTGATTTCVILAAAFGAARVRAQALPPPPARGAPAQMTLFLELVVNERASGQVVPVVFRDGHYYLAASVLQALSVRTGTAADAQVAVDLLAGVTVQYDGTGQRLKLSVPPEWLPNQEFGGGESTGAFAAISSTGALLNYDLYASNIGRSTANTSVWSEQRMFGQWGTLSNTGVWRHGVAPADRGYIRYDTRWTYSDTDQVRTTTAGDLIAAPLPWGSAVRIGGLQVARNFSIRPDLVTHPLPRFSGQAAVPSAVDLFINGYKASSENVQPGPFTLNTVPYVTGAGEAAVVTTDALGRQVVTTVPFYVANNLLTPGGTDYAVAAGPLRRDYGLKNFSYGPAVGSGGVRWGLSDSFTVEGRAEAAPSLAVLGAGGVAALGNYGVVNAAASGSQVRGRSGRQLNLGYQYSAQSFGIGAQTAVRNAGYSDLTNYDSPGTALTRRTSQINGSLSLGDVGALAAGYFDLKGADGSRTRLLSMSYSRPLGSSAFLSVNFNKAVGQRDYTLQFQVTIPLDDRANTTVTAVRDRNGTGGQLNYNRSAPPDGGLGWNLAYATSGNGGNYRQASATWRAGFAQFQAGVYAQGNVTANWAGAAGSVVLMDGGVFAANRINDAFVLVSTNGVADIPIRYENQVLGRTNQDGHLLVPTVPGYYPARFEVDVVDLPDYMQIAQPQQRLAVRGGSGALLRFGIERMLAARITLVDESGRPLPVGWSVQHVQSGQGTVVGWDGLVYLEGLKAMNDLAVRGPGNARCRVRFPIVVDTPQVLRIGPLTCVREQGTTTAFQDRRTDGAAAPSLYFAYSHEEI